MQQQMARDITRLSVLDVISQQSEKVLSKLDMELVLFYSFILNQTRKENSFPEFFSFGTCCQTKL